MKRIQLFVASMLLVSAFATISCQKESNNPEEDAQVPESQLETKTFAMVFDPETKLTITPQTPGVDNSVAKTTWDLGDEILIHGEYINKTGYSVVVMLDGVENTISEDGSTAFIQVTLGTGSEAGTVKPYTREDYISSIYAAYPASSVIKTETRSYYYNVFSNTNAPLMSGYDDGEGAIVFRNNCAVLSFVMPNTEDFDSYVFSGNNDEVVGYDSFVARHAQGTTELKKDQGINSSGLYTSGESTSISGVVVCDGETINRICIPTKSGTPYNNEVTFTNGFTIKFIKNGEIKKKVSTKNSLTLARNDYMPLGDISSHLKTYTDPHSPAAWTTSATDLSEAKTKVANCYVVYTSAAGTAYKIPAVKGNDASATLIPYGAELLWETWNNAEVTPKSVIADVDYDSEWVYFKLPDAGDIHAGNALIAIRNALGEIIWSWHIWMPSTAYTTDTYNLYDHELMDRNLGALDKATISSVPVETYGLLYQWGRKDPFVGAATTTGSSNAAVSGTALSLSAVALTLDQSIQNPTVLGPSTNWLNVTNNDLWKNNEKTLYDPCPAGYKVPGYDSGQPLCSSNYADVTGWTDNKDGRYFTLGNPATVFPYTGYREEGGTTINKAGQRSATWLSYSESSSGYAFHMNVRTESTHKTENTAKARNCSIRCAKIEKAPVFNPTERENAADMSEDESANCYIVRADDDSNESKIFKFRAVKGNSYVNGSSEGETVGSAATATVLWETWNDNNSVTTGSVINLVDYYDGYVYFKMPASLHAGNAVIAVKNSAGTILWSWHIWVPSSDPTATLYTFGGQSWMDRNLGALTVAEASDSATPSPSSFGFFYAWGRKDPFPGLASLSSSSAITTTGSFNYSGSPMTMEQSYALPTTFVATGSDQKRNWATDAGATIAGFWGSSKTIYDPCPPGYIVPALTTSSGSLWNGSHASDESKRAVGFTIDGTHLWYKAGVNPDYIVFPIAGFLDGCQSSAYIRRGDRSLIWSSNNTAIDAEKGNLANTLRVYNSSGTWKSTNESERHARGFNVRCVAVPAE